MKKLLVTLVAAAVCIGASAEKKDIRWDFGAYAALSYNASFPLPDRMVTSGLGFDLSLINFKIYVAPSTFRGHPGFHGRFPLPPQGQHVPE